MCSLSSKFRPLIKGKNRCISVEVFWQSRQTKDFLVNPKQIATQMFLGFLWRYTLLKQHTKSIPKSENMKFDFCSFLVYVLAYFAIQNIHQYV